MNRNTRPVRQLDNNELENTMAQDFRELLKEEERTDWGRTYSEIVIDGVFGVSIQASDAHGSIPEETLEDPFAYEAFEVTLRQMNVPFIDSPGRGAWENFTKEEWYSRFDRGMIAGLRIAELVEVPVVQAVYERLLRYVEEKESPVNVD